MAIFNSGAGILFTPNSEWQLALKRLGNRGARVRDLKTRNASAWCGGGSFHMELVVENGWNGNELMLDRLTSFRRGTDEATDPNTPTRAHVVEDKDAHHFYVGRPGLKVGWTCRWRTSRGSGATSPLR